MISHSAFVSMRKIYLESRRSEGGLREIFGFRAVSGMKVKNRSMEKKYREINFDIFEIYPLVFLG